jgi:hypothetical protein
VQFCLHLHHEAGLGQLLLQLPFLPLQAGNPLLTRPTGVGPVAWPAPPAHPCRGPSATPRYGWDTGPPGVAVHPVRHRCRVVGGEDLQLVLRGERTPPGPLGDLRVGTSRSSTSHPPGICDPGRSVEPGHGHCHVGSLHPRPRVTIVRGVPQLRLAERRRCAWRADRFGPRGRSRRPYGPSSRYRRSHV